MKTQFFSPSRISAGCRNALIVAMAGLISAALPAKASEDIYFPQTPSFTQASAISQEALDSMLAPIALYPDPLLAQVLMASTFPMDVIEAARWRQEHPDLGGRALQDALDSFNWDTSVKSLVTVPQVLQYMNDSPRWMWDLGRAVIEDQPRVIASVQALRQKAHATGTLVSNDKQTVRIDKDTTRRGERIAIEPASPQVVYVPVYDPYVVYGPWWWPSRPYYWGPPVGAAFASGFFWGTYFYPSVALWGGFNWGIGMMTINVPVYRSYHRRAPLSMGPNNTWRRASSRGSGGGGGHYYYSPHYDRSPMRSSPSYISSDRGQHSPSYRSSGASPSREASRGSGTRGDFRRGGGTSSGRHRH